MRGVNRAVSGVRWYAMHAVYVLENRISNAWQGQHAGQQWGAAGYDPAAYGGVPQWGAGGGSRQSTGPKNANVFVYNLPNELVDQQLRGMFMSFGNILSVNINVDRMTVRAIEARVLF